MASVTINGHTYSDDADPSTGLGGGGHRARFIPLVQDVVAVTGAAEALNATPVSTFAWTLLDDTTAGGMRATLGAASSSNPDFVPSSADTAGLVRITPSGTGGRSDIQLYSASDKANSSFLSFAALPTLVTIGANRTGSGSFGPMDFYSSDTLRLRLGTNGNFIIGNSGTDDGSGAKLQVNGAVNLASGNAYKINNVQLVSARATGWGAATGTATRTTFATSTVTTAQLAERVKALIDDLISHGLIGA